MVVVVDALSRKMALYILILSEDAFCLSVRLLGIPLRFPFLLLYQVTASLFDGMNHFFVQVLSSARLTFFLVSPAYIRPHIAPAD